MHIRTEYKLSRTEDLRPEVNALVQDWGKAWKSGATVRNAFGHWWGEVEHCLTVTVDWPIEDAARLTDMLSDLEQDFATIGGIRFVHKTQYTLEMTQLDLEDLR